MGDGIGDVAKSWLADPPWQKVFKHTFDVIVDYVTYILVAIGGVALSVRLLTTLSTGDLVRLSIRARGASPRLFCPLEETRDTLKEFFYRAPSGKILVTA